MDLVMRLSHKVVVMAHGQVIAEGSPKAVQSNPAVLRPISGARRRPRHGSAMPDLLEVKDVVAGYGCGPDILNGATLTVRAGQSQCIIGPNGAGKSTLLKAIVGAVADPRG